MKPLLITYKCIFCSNEHQEIVFSAETIYEHKRYRCNLCKLGRTAEMELKLEEPIITLDKLRI